jgi:hypothetical protein
VNFVVLGFELGLVLARQLLYCLGHISSPFCSGCFGDRVVLFGWPAWTTIFLFRLPAVAGMTGAQNHAQFFSVVKGSCELFAQAGLEPGSS